MAFIAASSYQMEIFYLPDLSVSFENFGIMSGIENKNLNPHTTWQDGVIM